MFRAIVWGLVLLVPLPAAWSAQDKNADAKKGADKGLKIEAELTADDPKENNKHYKLYEFEMEQGKTYVIDMISRVGDPRKFDPYLILKDSGGRILAQDDDGGGFPNAQIVFTASKKDTYKILATTLGGGTGKFRLTVGPASAALAQYKKMQNELRTEAQKIFGDAKGDREQAQAKLADMVVGYVEKLDKLIRANKGDPVAKMAQNEVDGMLNFLVQSGSPAANKLIRGMLDKATDNAEKGQLSLMLGQTLRSQYEAAYRKGEKEQATKIAAEAEDLLGKAKEKGGPTAKQAEDALFLLQKLSVGKVAPDIEGEDMEGKKFKLSDYRGKVVVLDYWAFW